MLHWISNTRRLDHKPYSPSSIARVNRYEKDRKSIYTEASEIVDETIRTITNRAFSRAYLRVDDLEGTWEGVRTALGILDLQAEQRSVLAVPYNSVPRKTWLASLRALDLLIKKGKRRGTEAQFAQGDAALAVLTRLCTCDGVRGSVTTRAIGSESPSSYPVRMIMDERDFNGILHGMANMGRMDLAEAVVTLQDQTEHAPPLGAVTFSILVKGYGREKDAESVGDVWEYVREKGMEADTVLYNSLIDAYINCGDVDRAYTTFLDITQPKDEITEEGLFERALPNVRTYNTMLKGFVKAGEEERALELTRDMVKKGIWDDVTTNTLVGVLVAVRNFELAEVVLVNSTSTIEVGRGRHPNVEAYTDLLNGYGRAGMCDKALSTLRTMRQRGVHPNEHTYSSMIGALARSQKISQARKMIDFMEFNDQLKPSAITYNSFLTGMLEKPVEDYYPGLDQGYDAAAHLAFNGRVDVAIDVVKEMMQARIKPNAITVSTMIDALGRCDPPRLNQAKALAAKFDELGYVPLQGARVSTAMIQACGRSNDLEGVVETFGRIAKPDAVAFNTYLDSCCRCGEVKMALDGLKDNAVRSQSEKSFVLPDVATYTVLISTLLKIGNVAASDHTRKLYREMKQLWGIQPDKGLVDIILVAMVSGGNSLGLSDKDVKFTYEVLRDARKLDLSPEHFERRERAVKAVIVGRMSEVWKEDTVSYGMDEGPLERHNWNQINSRFRLWGSGNNILEDVKNMGQSAMADADDFLESKNWNSMNSGFRLF